MLTYNQAKLMWDTRKRKQVKLCHETYLEEIDNNTMGIRYHGTYIVKIHANGNFTLDNGGYRTKTTKQRINEYSPARIFQKNFEWYCGNVVFHNGMEVRNV